MKNKHGIIVGLLILAAICISLWLLSDRQPDAPATDKAKVIADHDTLLAHGVDYRRIVDSLNIDNYRLDNANKSLKQGQATTRKQLDLKSAEVRELAKEVQRHNKDTGDQARRIDSLVALVENYAFLLSQYEAHSDSINNVNDSLKITYEAKDMEKDKRIYELQVAYDNLFKAYQQLFADNIKARKTIKRERLKTKIGLLLGLFTGSAGTSLIK